MTPLTLEQREYKQKTLNQLLITQTELQTQLAQSSQSEVVRSLRNQLEEVQTHIDQLQMELEHDVAAKPVADELCQRVANALTKEKYFMAKKYLGKLETIEPFYPGLDRLREEVEAQRASRRTRAIAQGTALPYGAATFPAATTDAAVSQSSASAATIVDLPASQGKRRNLSQFFQFHIVISCLVIMLIICVMLGVGSVTVLEWLFQGGI